MKSKPLVGPPPLENGFEEIAVTLVLGVMKQQQQPLDLDTSHAFTLPEGFVKMAPIVSFFMVLLLIHWMPLLAPLVSSLRGWNSERSLLGSTRHHSFKE